MRLRSAGWASVGDTPTDRPGLFAQVVVRMFFDLPVSLFGLNGPSGWLCQAEAHRSNDRWGGAGSDLALLAESLHGRLYALPGDNVRFSKQTSRRPLVPKNVFFFRIFLITPSPIPIINYLSTKSSSLPNRDKSVKYPFHSLQEQGVRRKALVCLLNSCQSHRASGHGGSIGTRPPLRSLWAGAQELVSLIVLLQPSTHLFNLFLECFGSLSKHTQCFFGQPDCALVVAVCRHQSPRKTKQPAPMSLRVTGLLLADAHNLFERSQSLLRTAL
jgi:hypothetical protein